MTTTRTISSSELPLNSFERADNGQLIFKVDDAMMEFMRSDVVDDPEFTVHYSDEKTFIAQADDGSWGAFARVPDGSWEGRVNVPDDTTAADRIKAIAQGMSALKALADMIEAIKN